VERPTLSGMSDIPQTGSPVSGVQAGVPGQDSTDNALGGAVAGGGPTHRPDDQDVPGEGASGDPGDTLADDERPGATRVEPPVADDDGIGMTSGA
jgi:hypothetical protein